MQELIDRRWNELCEAVNKFGDHPETWNRAAAFAEVRLQSCLDMFLSAWEETR